MIAKIQYSKFFYRICKVEIKNANELYIDDKLRGKNR